MNYVTTLFARSALVTVLLAGSVAAAQAEMVFHRGNGADPETLDIHKSTGVPESWVQFDLFEGLMTVAADGTVVPGVAESHTISDDGLVYTFKLREDAKWSDGTPVTAEDFVFSMQRLVNPATASDYAYFLRPIRNAGEITAGTVTDLSQLGVKALDDKTLEITLHSPTPYFLSSLVHHSTYALSKANYEEFGDDYVKAGNLVSNGAYMLAEAVPQSHVKLVKNPNFHDAENVKVDTVFFYPTEDLDAELKRYRAGELDITYEVPAQQIPWVEENLPDQFHSTLYFGTYFYTFNLTKEPWASSEDLRKALSLAIDRDILTEKILQGGEIPAYSFVPAGTENYDVQSPEYASMTQAQRLDLAKQLFTEAGYGPDNPLDVEIIYNTSDNHKKVAVAIAAMWKQNLGVNTTLNNQEWKVFLETRDQKTFKDVARHGWIGDYNDANNFLELLTTDIGPQNPAGYSNPEFDDLMRQASVTPDLQARADMMEEAERIMLEDMPIIPIYTYTTQHMVSPAVSGWEDNLQDVHLTRYITVQR